MIDFDFFFKFLNKKTELFDSDNPLFVGGKILLVFGLLLLKLVLCHINKMEGAVEIVIDGMLFCKVDKTD